MRWGANQIDDALNSSWPPGALTGFARVLNGIQRSAAAVVVKGERCQFVIFHGVC